MSSTDFISIAFGLMALLVTVVGIRVTIALAAISHAQTREAQKFVTVQQFETTFFNLLNLQRQIVNGMDLRGNKNKNLIVAVGSDCFKTFHKYFKKGINTKKEDNYLKAFPLAFNKDIARKTILSHDEVIICYLKVFYKHQGDLVHYFNNLLQIIKFVDESDAILDREKYIKFVKAQLSAHELFFMYYYGLTELGKEFKGLIEKYDLLEHVELTYIIGSTNRPNESYYRFPKRKSTI